MGAEKFITKPTDKYGFDQMITTIIEVASAKSEKEC
jgi:hypothetical protein